MLNDKVLNMVHKLKLFGAEILSYNSFAIIYRINKELHMVRYVINNSKHNISVKEETDFSEFNMTPYFVELHSGPFNLGIYTAYSQNSILNSKFCFIDSYIEEYRASCSWLGGSGKVILVGNTTGRLFIINYKGKKINITKSRNDRERLKLGIIHDQSIGRYIVGCGKGDRTNNNVIAENMVRKLEYVLLDTDDELRVNYH